VDFLEKEMHHDRRCRILDVGCGTGRHSIELAARGYSVVGVDLSESQLRRARLKAGEKGASVTFLQQDARNLTFCQEFDLAIILCEGAFSLMETDEMNFQILQGVARALKPAGKFILTTLNALYPLYHSVKDFINAEAQSTTSVENHFDLLTFRDRSVVESADDDGNMRTLHCNERYYAPSEITWLLQSLGFRKVEIFGAKLGTFSRENPLTVNDYEMLVVAEK
jgi:SAM-dependent methyltransferase